MSQLLSNHWRACCTYKWRARYRDAAGREHARHFGRKLDAQRWVESQETAKSVQLKASTRARYARVLRMQVLPTWERVPLKAVTHTVSR